MSRSKEVTGLIITKALSHYMDQQRSKLTTQLSADEKEVFDLLTFFEEEENSDFHFEWNRFKTIMIP